MRAATAWAILVAADAVIVIFLLRWHSFVISAAYVFAAIHELLLLLQKLTAHIIYKILLTHIIIIINIGCAI